MGQLKRTSKKDDPNYFPVRKRTYGKTRDCKGCRFWSEQNARVEGNKPLMALCLNRDSKYAYLFRAGNDWCHEWADGAGGAIDDPNSEYAVFGTRTSFRR